MDARESHDHLVAEPIERVVRPSRPDRLDRKVRPLRKLRRDQPADERYVGVYLVGVHLARVHTPPHPAHDDAGRRTWRGPVIGNVPRTVALQ